MHCLVTGGAGFIGSYMCEHIVESGNTFTVWDNLFRGRFENIAYLLNKDNTFINIDMADADNVDQMADLILEQKPDVIFHYAAINGTQYFYDIPAKVLEDNVDCTCNLMRAVRKAKLQHPDFKTKVVYASSSEVYGEPLHLPSLESDITYVVTEHVRDSYAAAKLVGEFYVKLISEELDLPWIALRLFNVYGPRMVGTKYGQVIPEFVKRLAEGEYPLRIYGNGEHMRSFCFVTDNVAFTWDLAVSDAPSGIYNIGSQDEVSIKQVAETIMQKMELDPKFEFLPEREGDHKRRCPDTSRLHSAIGPRNYMSLDEGLDIMLAAANNE